MWKIRLSTEVEITPFAARERGKDRHYSGTIYHKPILDVFVDYTVLAH